MLYLILRRLSSSFWKEMERVDFLGVKPCTFWEVVASLRRLERSLASPVALLAGSRQSAVERKEGFWW